MGMSKNLLPLPHIFCRYRCRSLLSLWSQLLEGLVVIDYNNFVDIGATELRD